MKSQQEKKELEINLYKALGGNEVEELHGEMLAKGMMKRETF